jgi:hypothetical protein
MEGKEASKKKFLFLMAELGNCAACLQPFHDSAQQHTCKGCGGKIHSSILYPKGVDHEEDNWCSDRAPFFTDFEGFQSNFFLFLELFLIMLMNCS